jgi:hypothetical protein
LTTGIGGKCKKEGEPYEIGDGDIDVFKMQGWNLELGSDSWK